MLVPWVGLFDAEGRAKDGSRTGVGSAVGREVGFAIGPGEGKGVGIAMLRRCCMCSLVQAWHFHFRS